MWATIHSILYYTSKFSDIAPLLLLAVHCRVVFEYSCTGTEFSVPTKQRQWTWESEIHTWLAHLRLSSPFAWCDTLFWLGWKCSGRTTLKQPERMRLYVRCCLYCITISVSLSNRVSISCSQCNAAAAWDYFVQRPKRRVWNILIDLLFECVRTCVRSISCPVSTARVLLYQKQQKIQQ